MRLSFLNERDNVHYTKYTASPSGRYIARYKKWSVIEIFQMSGERNVIKKLYDLSILCFVNDFSLLVIVDSMIIEYTVYGEHIRHFFVEHSPYSLVCDGFYLLYTSVMEKAVLVHDYSSGMLLRKIGLGWEFQGGLLSLTKSTKPSVVLVHDCYSGIIGILNYRSATLVGYVHTAAPYYAGSLFDFGDVFGVETIHSFLELREWKGRSIVDTFKIRGDIVASAAESKQFLIKTSTATFEWYKPWHFTSRSNWIRAVVLFALIQN